MGPLVMGRPVRAAAISGAALQCSPEPKRRLPLPLQPPAHPLIGGVELQADHRHPPLVFEVRCLRLAAPPRHPHLTAGRGGDVGARRRHVLMTPSATDINPLPHRWPNLMPPRVEHIIARLKDRQTLRQCRRRDDAINHNVLIIAGPRNLKTHTQSRVN
jgi:hypothetical protein